jgi:RimJ/RimL family protein N-acetyltransferase
MLENPKLRLLGKEELYKLKRFYREEGSKINPSQSLFTAAVAELEDETIVGMLGFELVPHVGPLFVRESYRGQGLAGRLYGIVEDQLDKRPGTGYYTFPSNDASRRVAEKLGLEKLNWDIWKREY